MGRVTEIGASALLDAIADVERAEQRVGVAKAYVHLGQLVREGRQAELLALLEGLEQAEEALLDAHDKACETSEVLMALLDPGGSLRGGPVLGPAAEA
jgi:hypothetical protein